MAVPYKTLLSAMSDAFEAVRLMSQNWQRLCKKMGVVPEVAADVVETEGSGLRLFLSEGDRTAILIRRGARWISEERLPDVPLGPADASYEALTTAFDLLLAQKAKEAMERRTLVMVATYVTLESQGTKDNQLLVRVHIPPGAAGPKQVSAEVTTHFRLYGNAVSFSPTPQPRETEPWSAFIPSA